VRRDDRSYQSRKAPLQLRAARYISYLDAVALASNQAGVAKNLEVLWQGGFWNRLIPYRQEIRGGNRLIVNLSRWNFG
jgi:hypothetical protein